MIILETDKDKIKELIDVFDAEYVVEYYENFTKVRCDVFTKPTLNKVLYGFKFPFLAEYWDDSEDYPVSVKYYCNISSNPISFSCSQYELEANELCVVIDLLSKDLSFSDRIKYSLNFIGCPLSVDTYKYPFQDSKLPNVVESF